MSEQASQLAMDFERPPRRRPSLSFWHPMTGELDKKYLRVCSVYRLLRKKKIGRERAIELLAMRHSPTEMKTLRGTVEVWRSCALKDMLP